jgi:O-antigen/teichoic acid export membrane protein
MGGYTLADEISAMPSGELLAPINRVLFPAFVGAKENLDELKRLFLLAQGVQTLIAIPVAVGLAMVAHEAVLVLLGEKCLLVVPFLQLLALANVFEAITTSGGYVMITLGKVRNVALLAWVRVATFVVAVFLGIPSADAMQIAGIRVITVFSGLALALWLVMRTMGNVSFREIAATIARPLLGAAIMAAVLYFGISSISLALFPALLLKIFTGIVVYSVSVMLLWWLADKPTGTESYLIEKITNAIVRLKKNPD